MQPKVTTLRLRIVSAAGAAAIVGAGCGGEREHGAPPPIASAPAVVQPPPQTSFEIVEEMPRKPGTPAAIPPEAALGPWRVWVNQERPRQKKNPHWQSYPAREGIDLPMQEGSSFRCLLTPIKATAKAEEDGSIEAWIIWRSVRCSSDGWGTYVEAQLDFAVSSDGTRTARAETSELYLRETLDGKPRETTVVLRADGAPGKNAPPAAASAPPASSGAPAPSASAK